MHDSLQLLQLYAPTLFECSQKSESDSVFICKKYDQRRISMQRAIDDKGGFRAGTCVFDLLWNASENLYTTKDYLAFIDQTVRRALDATQGDMRKQLEKLVVKMIVSFGEERCEYKNHFTEIALAEKLMTGGLKLEGIEVPLPNGKRIDFEFSKDGFHYLVEVVNIEFKSERLKTCDDLKQFLEARLVGKFISKLGDDSNAKFKFQVAPVLWGDMLSLEPFMEAFEYFRPFRKAGIITPIMTIAQVTNQADGSVNFGLVEVEALLARVRYQKQGALN